MWKLSTPFFCWCNNNFSDYGSQLGTLISHCSTDGCLSVDKQSRDTNPCLEPLSASSSSSSSVTEADTRPTNKSEGKENTPPEAVLHDEAQLLRTKLQRRKLPVAGSTSHMLPRRQKVCNENRSALLQQVKKYNQLCWRQVPGEQLKVRSKRFLHNKEKKPSLGELYECVGVDFFDSDHRLVDIASRVRFPANTNKDTISGSSGSKSNSPKTSSGDKLLWHAPDVFMVTLSLPFDPWGGKDDGPTSTIVLYFRIKESTINILQKLHSQDEKERKDAAKDPNMNAIRLFNDWCRLAPNDADTQARFKFIPFTENIDDLGLPRWMLSSNGKPVLIKRTGTTGFLRLHPELNCMEFEVSFHPFPWAAKKAIKFLREKILSNALLTFGFLIEGREEDELPEALIGLSQLCYPVFERHAVHADTFFNA